ncbi:glycosyltransferase family 4 protein [Butyrivibrio sp. TB]|uniref:glycosyltransferase family 4 protein n=1 Tax=Butyrivibrio sp. TB TaxID=1520809 RepID=UPI0008C22D8C|nr:glycosyltransferase family 4 protein [Butyrivibrio sp. TB]SEQ15147.1 Glycosyl transferases group 1 [Butyrivibrio sp. TB]
MRILYFLAHPYVVGGAARQLLAHARISSIMGNSVKVIIQEDRSGGHDKQYENLCSSLCLEWGTEIYNSATCIEELDIITAIKDADRIDEIITNYKPDIIHYMQLNPAVEISAERNRIPCLMSIYPVNKRSFNIKWEKVFPCYHCCDSLWFSKIWSEGLGIRSECIRVAYECTSAKLDRIIPYGEKKSYEVVCVAHFAWLKNQLEILKFINICAQNGIDIHISFLGECNNEYFEKCLNYVRKNQIESYVTFVGYSDQVGEYLVNADLLIHASLMESYPGAVVEAMANGVPIIVTPIAGIKELVQDGENGFLTSDYSAEAIYEKFAEFIELRNNGKLKDIISNEIDTYKSYHTYSVVGDALKSYYHEIVDGLGTHKSYSITKRVLKQLNSFYQDKLVGEYSKFTQEHCWYLYHLDRVCEKYHNAMIWGTGQLGSIGVEWCNILNLKVEGYIDTYKEGTFLGYRVYKPVREVIDSVDCIIVSMGRPESVEAVMYQLEEYGKQLNVDYFIVCNNPCYLPHLHE